jgi:4-hydroxy-2-oxoheptanedioate aldolase
MMATALQPRDPRNGPAIGIWVKLATAESTEIIAAAGFDFCVVDMEHTLLSTESVYQHIVVGSASGIPVLVRVPDIAGAVIQRVLDAGAAGVVVPHVDTAADAELASAACRFAPAGHRGSGGTSRRGGWGARARDHYLDDIGLCVLQIESSRAVGNVESIMTTPGVSAVMLGPADLGLDLRRDGNLPSVHQQAERVRTVARQRGIPVGTACAAKSLPDVVSQGYDFIVCGNDSTLLSDSARETVSALRVLTGVRE